MIGIALMAVLMCVNFTSCSEDDDPTEVKNENGIVTSGKKLVKIVGKSENGSYSENFITYSYDNKGRLVAATVMGGEENYSSTETFDFIWGDDVIKVTKTFDFIWGDDGNKTYTETYTLTLNNGLVQYEDYGDGTGTYAYNSKNRFIEFSDVEYEWRTTAIWDGDKLAAISEYDNEGKLTYGKTCSKGYFPFIATIIGAGECEVLFMAHPEIAGMRTSQLPQSITWTHTDYSGKTDSSTDTFTYEFDKEGYISKIISEYTTYTLVWE